MDEHTPIGVLKQCSRCQHFKINTEFHKSPTARDGLQSRCKQCQIELAAQYAKAHPDRIRETQKKWRHAHREHVNKRQRDWHKKHPGKSTEYDHKRHYGLPTGGYAAMLSAQAGKCAICGTTDPGFHKHFHVDHCHKTKAVRGLLCGACNLGLGKFKHEPTILESAIRYLTQRSR